MWLESELARLSGLYSSVQQPAIETVIKTEDIATIENFTITEFNGLKNGLFVPKVRFQGHSYLTLL